MDYASTVVGVLWFFLTVVALVAKYLRAPRRHRFRGHGWAGLGIVLLAEILLFAGVRWVATFFTPIAWTGYLLMVDAAVWSLRGESRLVSTPRHFFALAFWSVPLWLIFEAYNLRMENWTYVGLPANLAVRYVGYGWSFATIWPAILETADLIEALGIFRTVEKPRTELRRAALVSFSFFGLIFVAAPVLVPAPVGQYLFGPVWLGFALLLDPLNYAAGGRSLLREYESGRTSTLFSLLLAGLVCGIVWEFWNYWAAAKWVYVFPILQGWKIFEMPLPGYLGFPPFAVECFVMYEFLKIVRLRVTNQRILAGQDVTRTGRVELTSLPQGTKPSAPQGEKQR
ncbi:MAG: hypothetical protein ACE145_17415 [Terriglobia bacterium]